MSLWTRLPLLLAVGLLLAACGGGEDDLAAETATDAAAEPVAADDATLTVYNGRNIEFMGPLLDAFTEETGIEVEIVDGDTVELAAQILEEGDNSPADVYIGQDGGTLGLLADEGRLQALETDAIEAVPASLRDSRDRWVGLSARARVIAYGNEVLDESEVPDSVWTLIEPEWEGRVGWAPTNASFHSFVTAVRHLEGDDRARELITGLQDNDAIVYENNSGIMQGIRDGEVEVGLVNHYYAYSLADELDGAVDNKFLPAEDVGALVNVAGGGIVDTSDDVEAATALIDYLLSDEAQEAVSSDVGEIPVVDSVEPAEGVPSLAEVNLLDVDLNELADLEGTLTLLRDTGAID